MNIARPFPNICIRTTITVNLSADQWCLRTQDHDRGTVDKVANLLNKRVTLVFNRGENAEHLRLAFNGLKRDFDIYVTEQTDSVFENILPTLYRQ
jgi:hypothetical protein